MHSLVRVHTFIVKYLFITWNKEQKPRDNYAWNTMLFKWTEAKFRKWSILKAL